MSKRILSKGDIILLSNDPKPNGENHEQRGTRPWLVVSERLLNQTSPFVWIIPFTTSARQYPLLVNWSELVDSRTKGVLLVNQLTTVDVDQRAYQYLEHVEIPEEVFDKIKAILGII